jgi:hypothetical protein
MPAASTFGHEPLMQSPTPAALDRARPRRTVSAATRGSRYAGGLACSSEQIVSDPIIKSLSFERKLTSSEAHQHCMALPARKLTDMSTSPTPSPSPLARPPVRPSTPHWCRPARRHPGCPRRQRSKGAVRIGAGGLPGPVAAGGAGRHRRTVRPGAALGSHDDTVRQRDLSCLRNQHGH